MYTRCSMALRGAGWWRYVRVSLQLLAPAQAPWCQLNSAKFQQGISAVRMGVFPHESHSLCPLRPLLTRVAVKELIHFMGPCYSGGSSPCTQQASSLLSDQQPWQKPHTIGFIILFTSLPVLLTRITLRYGDRKSAKMARAAGQAWRGTAEGSTRSSARGSRSSRANHGSSLQGGSFSTSTKPFKRTL